MLEHLGVRCVGMGHDEIWLLFDQSSCSHETGSEEFAGGIVLHLDDRGDGLCVLFVSLASEEASSFGGEKWCSLVRWIRDM